MGNPLDYSKLSDEELAAIQSHDYSKLSDSTLQALSEDDSHGAPIADVEHEMIPMPKMSAPGVGTGAAIIAGGAKTLKAVKPYLPERLGGTPAGQSSSSLQRYLNGSLQDNGMKPVPLSRLSQVTGMPVRSTSEIQAAVDAIKAVPGERIPVKKLVDGVEKIVRYDTIPAREAANLESPLIKALPNVGKYIEPVVRNAGKVARFAQGPLAIGAVVGQAQDVMNRKDTDPTGAVISGIGGIGAAASPWFPPAAAVPAAAMAINYARDNPDYVAKYKNPEWVPKFSGGGLAEGGESNTAPFIGYPHITNKPRDPNFVQQSGPVLGGLDAILGLGARNDVSMLTPEGQAYHESYDKYEPVGIASNVLPFMGGPTKAVGKAALRELGPKAAGMAENYLTKIGGIAHAMPPGESSFAQRVLSPPTAEEIAQFAPKPTRDVKYSDAIQNHIGEYLGLHMSDPYGVHGGRKGGTGFGNFQNIDPLHAKNEVVWMNDSKEAAQKLAGQDNFNGSPIVWSNYIGSPNQHISNKTVANEILQDVYKNHPNMSPDTVERTNQWLQNKFGIKGLDIRDKDAMSELLNKSFDARKQFGNLAQGYGAGKNKVVLSPNWQNILDESRDPFIAGADTSAIGTRLSRIHNEPPQFSTDFHPDYRWTVHGKDLGVRFPAVPQAVAVPDWFRRYQQNNVSKNGKPLEPHGNAWFGYMKTPQKIDENYIKSVQAAGYAPGGRVLSALGKSLGEAQAAYKAKFTPDFYHASPSNKIKAFDASKGDRAFPTEGVTFLTKEPEFSHSFIDVHKNKTSGGWDYNKGSTIYPVSANLGKHFDPATPEGSETIKQYLQNKYSKEAGTDYFDDAINQKHEHMMDRLTDPVNNWKLLESPGLLDHLKNTGHNSFSVTEGGIKNVGVFNPADIRGKFAKFNPEDAASPDFMKAEGGSIEGYAPGGSVLSKMGAIAKDLSLPAAENAARTQIIGTLPTYGKAADMLAQRGATGQAIDFGAGLGKGAELLGPGTHTYEPFAQNWNPTYSNAKDIPSDAYGRLTNLNVLNVVPREARDEIVQNIGRVIEPGGQGIITTRGADVMKAQGRPGPEPTSVITSRDTYQKGFSKQELEDYLKYMLGQGYDINKINLGPAGVHIQKKAEGGLAQSFNPQGADYDYQTALAHGMGPTGTGENQGHWGSVAPVSDDEQQLHDLPSDSYTVLKGKSHPTFYKAEAAENERGSEIVKKGDRYYSVPKK